MRAGFLIAGGGAALLLIGAAFLGLMSGNMAGFPGVPFGGDALAWVIEQQREFHRELTGLLASLKDEHRSTVVFGLLGSSFAYGVFHAAGPGHGKAVLTAYLFSNGASVRRGLGLATAASFLQGVVALALVYGLVVLGGLLPRDSQAAAAWAERISFALVALVGAYLLLRSVTSLRRRLYAAPGDGPHEHGHTHTHTHAHAHAHTHAHCGHDHFPSPEMAERATDLRAACGLVLSIGLRPCSGAIIVLVFAQALGLAWAGVGAVVAMSAGTALAVAALALLAVGARGFALSIAGSSGSRHLGVATDLLALFGGLFIVAVGLALLSGSFEPRHPLGL